MGMCSRQERIQKDIDVVIQKSKAEKDCLFAGEFSRFRSLGPSASFLSLPAAPLPSVLTATCVSGGGGWVARSPLRGSFGNSCCCESGNQKREGRQPLPFSLPPSLGQPLALGAERGWPERGSRQGALRCIFNPPMDAPSVQSRLRGFSSSDRAERVGPACF